jgi:hypothetical protein
MIVSLDQHSYQGIDTSNQVENRHIRSDEADPYTDRECCLSKKEIVKIETKSIDSSRIAKSLPKILMGASSSRSVG